MHSFQLGWICLWMSLVQVLFEHIKAEKWLLPWLIWASLSPTPRCTLSDGRMLIIYPCCILCHPTLVFCNDDGMIILCPLSKTMPKTWSQLAFREESLWVRMCLSSRRLIFKSLAQRHPPNWQDRRGSVDASCLGARTRPRHVRVHAWVWCERHRHRHRLHCLMLHEC